MASESSSAVLELNDADGDDTEAPSVTDDARDHEGAPLIMEHGYDIAVKVDAPMKQLSTLETFVTYRVRCVCARWSAPPYVRRRYNHFKVLHKRLTQAHPLIAPPPLPPLHSARQQLDRYSPSFVAVRTLALHAFLDRVAKHPILTHSDDFRIFLTTPDDELDKVFKSENSALNLWGLSSALYGGNAESKPTNGARVKDPEFTSAADYLQSLQQKLTTLCSLTTKLHKGSTALGNELMGMKRVCDAWATQAGGRTAMAAAGCGAGAERAGAALMRHRYEVGAFFQIPTIPRHLLHHLAPHIQRATLPLVAAYAAAHVEKIRERDAIHAAHVAGNNTDELHNRLEQASEALRSELSDWIPKTHKEIKALLLDLADKQVNIHTQTLMGWEHALKLSAELNPEELFKTVSKTAVQNLSPSKSKPDTPTERDFDDYDDDSDTRLDDDAKIENDLSKLSGKMSLELREDELKFSGNTSSDLRLDDVKIEDDVSKLIRKMSLDLRGDELKFSGTSSDLRLDDDMKFLGKLSLDLRDGDSKLSEKISSSLRLGDDDKIERDASNSFEKLSSDLRDGDSKLSERMSSNLRSGDDDKIESDASNNLGKLSLDLRDGDSKLSEKISSDLSVNDEKTDVSKSEKISDPLQDFSEIDLS